MQQQQQPQQQQQQQKPLDPEYGNLKNGQKPTYRNWLKATQKLPLSTEKISFESEREKRLNELREKQKLHQTQQSQILDLENVDLNALSLQDFKLKEALEKELAVIDELKTKKEVETKKVKTITHKNTS